MIDDDVDVNGDALNKYNLFVRWEWVRKRERVNRNIVMDGEKRRENPVRVSVCVCVCGESLVLDVNKSWRKLEIHSVCAETFCIYLIQLRLRRAENFRKALFCYLDSFFGRLIIFLLVLCRKLVWKRKTCSFNLHRIAS